MAQNITLMGASYSAVPAVTLPKTGGGTASFTDVTDTTAAAADVASGKYFYTASGVRTQGTNSGGGGTSNVVTGCIRLYGGRSPYYQQSCPDRDHYLQRTQRARIYGSRSSSRGCDLPRKAGRHPHQYQEYQRS